MSKKVCENCSGTGYIEYLCPDCNGIGYIIELGNYKLCKYCGGKGIIGAEICPVCEGEGYVDEEDDNDDIKQKIQKYEKEAFEYFTSLGLVPDYDELIDYITEICANDLGIDYEQAYQIVKKYR